MGTLRKKICISITRRSWAFMMVVAFLVASTWIPVVQSRAFMLKDEIKSDCGSVASKDFSTINPLLSFARSQDLSVGTVFQSLAFKLASGPSKKGPGH